MEQALHSAHVLLCELGYLADEIKLPCLYFTYDVEVAGRKTKGQMLTAAHQRRAAEKALPGVSSVDGAQRLLEALRASSVQEPELPQAAEVALVS